MGFNIKRLLISGFITWLIIIISCLSMIPFVGDEMELALARFNLPPLSNISMLYFAIQSLVLSFVIIWMYVAMLQKFKNQIKTSIIVALVVWLLAYFFANTAMVVYGFMPVKLTIIGTVWGLIELLLGSMIGTRFYKE